MNPNGIPPLFFEAQSRMRFSATIAAFVRATLHSETTPVYYEKLMELNPALHHLGQRYDLFAKKLKNWQDDHSKKEEKPEPMPLRLFIQTLGKSTLRNLLASIQLDFSHPERLPRVAKDNYVLSPTKKLSKALEIEAECEEKRYPAPGAAFCAGLLWDFLIEEIETQKSLSNKTVLLTKIKEQWTAAVKQGWEAHRLAQSVSALKLAAWILPLALLWRLGDVWMEFIYPNHEASLENVPKDLHSLILSQHYTLIPCEIAAWTARNSELFPFAISQILASLHEPRLLQKSDPDGFRLATLLWKSQNP